jgi:NRPS condensation-like uncharacterized protein
MQKVLDIHSDLWHNRSMEKPILKFRLPEETHSKVKALASEANTTVTDILLACVLRALPYVEAKIKNTPK